MNEGSSWEGALSKVLSAYRHTPQESNVPSPARMMFSYSPRLKLTPGEQETANVCGEGGGVDIDVSYPFRVGQYVRVKLPPSKWSKGRSTYSAPKMVIERIGKYTYQLDDGQTWNARKMVRYSGDPQKYKN